ncbi:SDR family oxidoreductase [Lysinibacter sp. HNR]|uniref:SDR family oxidoreductase n=1 Tax=Lysinibacter sp. HNR TaxID=3031408 RepID=UPI00243594A5|nr:SDR family oxidoreductase [Lysinibacter sp. HNR]WGD36329.1 SDR family oxidoreductase [Lysinibacter sp. HNR]
MTSSTLFDLTGKRALVTGSSRGIGSTLAEGLASHGASVIVHGRNATQVERTRERIAESTLTTVSSILFDVTDETAVTEAIHTIENDLGAIDILVNNAGIQRRAPFTDFALTDWNDLVATNLTSAFLVGQQVARHMAQRGAGKIINIGSVQTALGRPGITPYAATKGGIGMLTKGMCADLAPLGIQVNALAPGYFATDLTAALVENAEFSTWVQKRTPAGRWGQAEDLVGTLIYLASSGSAFVNGQIVYVDGGMTAVV